MNIIISKYKKVADFCYNLFKIAEMPLYFSKFSNKLYSNFQKLFLLVYKQFRKFTYEELLTDLEDNLTLRAYLGLNKMLHYTTLIKFGKQLPEEVFDRLLLAFKKLIPEPKKVAIDATGISLDNASLHYCKRIQRPIKKRPFMKTSLIVDIEHYIILLCRMRKKVRHDVIDAEPLLKKLAKHYKPEIIYGDRGYDSREIFRICFEEVKAYPLILQKNMNVPQSRKWGAYRKITCGEFDYGEYLQRNKIETLNSMLKRKFNSNVKARCNKMQRIEVWTRIIAFNIDRLIKLADNLILIFIRIIRVSY